MLGVYLGSGGSRSPCSQVPPFSKHLEKGYPRVVPASRVAMDTSPLAYGFCSPLTFAAPVPKLINCDEFKCG